MSEIDALIIGASGQVGQALVRQLEEAGLSWKGTCHQHPEVDSNLRQIDLDDVGSAAALVAETKPGMVFFPSGWTHVDACEDDPERANRVNAQAPEAAARVAASLNAAFVFYSTEYVFGEHGGPFDEEAEPSPLGVYGASKLEGEKKVLAANPQALVLRTTVVYGPEPQGKNTAYQVLKRLKDKQPVRLPSDQVTTPSYNRDLARASLELVQKGEKGLFNVVGPERIDRASFAKLTAEVFGYENADLGGLETAGLKQKAKRPLDAGLTVLKLAQTLGWTPRGPREGLEAMRAEMLAEDRLP